MTTRRLRVPGWACSPLRSRCTRTLARNAAAHADVLFSLPGMQSFHLWTGVPPPTTINATHWFTLLTAAQQDAIRDRLASSPKSCLIVQRYVYDFIRAQGIATESPLTLWLKENFEPAFMFGSYEFWVRRGRHIAGIGTASADEAPNGRPRFRL